MVFLAGVKDNNLHTCFFEIYNLSKVNDMLYSPCFYIVYAVVTVKMVLIPIR